MEFYRETAVSIPANSPVGQPQVPTTAPPAAAAAVVSKTNSPGTPIFSRLDVNTLAASLLVKGVFYFVDVSRGKQTSIQQPARQQSLLQSVHIQYKKTISDTLTLLAGAATPQARPLVTAVKNILMNSAMVHSRMNGSSVNLASFLGSAISGAVCGLFSSALFYKGSGIKTGADFALKNMSVRLGNPKFFPRSLEASLVKAALSLVAGKVIGELINHRAVQRPETAGHQMTGSDRKHVNRLFWSIAGVGVVGALISFPGVKEQIADKLLGTSLEENDYKRLLQAEAITTDQSVLADIKGLLPKAAQLAAQAKAIRHEMPQAMYTVGTALLLYTVFTKTFNKADVENEFMRSQDPIKTRNTHAN